MGWNLNDMFPGLQEFKARLPQPHFPSLPQGWSNSLLTYLNRSTERRDGLAVLGRRGREFLGVDHPILGGAMSWVSEHGLVAALANAGVFGVIASGGLASEALDREIVLCRALTDRPFGVNLVTFDARIAEQIEVCLNRRVSHIVLGGGIPGAELIARAKANGARVICFAASLAMGQRLVRSGADALIVEGHEAGGHVGPLSTGVLVQEILPLMPVVPVFVAGGIGRGETILHYLAMGAAGCQLGTRFVCAHESRVHPATKATYLAAAGRDAVVSQQLDPKFRVIPVRALANEATGQFLDHQRIVIARHRAGEIALAEAQAAIEDFWSGRLRRAVVEGDVRQGSLMAGQSVGMVTREEPVAEIVLGLAEAAEARVLG